MKFKRSCGVLLHPTSLPGTFGIGDMGPEAYKFIDFLAASGQKLWQILPLNYPGYGNSPYNPISAFACNPYLISPDKLPIGTNGNTGIENGTIKQMPSYVTISHQSCNRSFCILEENHSVMVPLYCRQHLTD